MTRSVAAGEGLIRELGSVLLDVGLRSGNVTQANAVVVVPAQPEKARDRVAGQLRTDEEEEHGHDHRVVTGHPASETVQQLARPVSERE